MRWQASSGTFYDAITEVAPLDCFAPADGCGDVDPAQVYIYNDLDVIDFAKYIAI